MTSRAGRSILIVVIAAGLLGGWGWIRWNRLTTDEVLSRQIIASARNSFAYSIPDSEIKVRQLTVRRSPTGATFDGVLEVKRHDFVFEPGSAHSGKSVYRPAKFEATGTLAIPFDGSVKLTRQPIALMRGLGSIRPLYQALALHLRQRQQPDYREPWIRVEQEGANALFDACHEPYDVVLSGGESTGIIAMKVLRHQGRYREAASMIFRQVDPKIRPTEKWDGRAWEEMHLLRKEVDKAEGLTFDIKKYLAWAFDWDNDRPTFAPPLWLEKDGI